MKFSLRAAAAGTLLIAVAAAMFQPEAAWAPALVPFVWLTCVTIGIRYAKGRGRQCTLLAALGGFIGAVAVAGWIAISSQMTFSNASSPLLIVAIGTLGGAFLGTIVRVLMEGIVLRKQLDRERLRRSQSQ